MTKTILVCGFGPGISTGVAERFGKEGYEVALVARNAEKLEAGADLLAKKGVRARGFAADLSDADAVRDVVGKARAALGPIAAIHWNAYGQGAADLLVADKKALDGVLDVAVLGLLTAVQAALPDLTAQKGAVLVTNGGLGYLDAKIDTMAVEWGAMGLALANAAKSKLVGLLAAKLKPAGIYVGQVAVLGSVKGTPWDKGQATLEGSKVAEKFWEIQAARTQTYAEVAG